MKDLNKLIDHTILKSDATESDIRRVCNEAIEYSFRGVCVNPVWIEITSELLKDSGIKTISVCDFPLGASYTEVRIKEAELALGKGASEVDIVMNLSLFKTGRENQVIDDLEEISKAVHPEGRLKVIIEAPILNEEEIKNASELVEKSGADFIKTGTGMNGPVTLKQVNLIKEVCSLPVKAAGGIRDRKDAIELIDAGAEIIGTSSGVKILSG